MIARTAALLDRILELDEPVDRNALITLCYRDLAERVADVIGRRDVNWFAFGAWASGTAGAAIRGDGLPIDLGTSRHVAAGNLAIIENVAPPFIRWLREVEAEGAANQAALERALADPVFASSPRLAEAIRCYQAARDLSAVADPVTDAAGDKSAAELVLLANTLVGAHEQGLVDRFIDAAMPLGGVFGLVTTRFVYLRTPDGRVDVCRDVVAPPYLGGAMYPAPLEVLSQPELCSLCERFGQSTGADVSASNTLAWEDLDDRMGFILTFFRAHQRDPRFFDVPAEFLPLELPVHAIE
ncbi:hypothetical protein [Agromyces sp. H66]|uniref:hypothetical protein n=1 Tax=Agromyces sp. H66 TaxID=2529859 RepID=UPI0010AA5889|nr:hypothetical protein [Agromyces sp. H66]